jgi:DNA-binding NarL/FixJ family response regulator
MRAAEVILKDELRRFGSQWQLTPRENEILTILCEGVVRIKDIASKLSLSPNTVNNHVNSIFAKTRTRSKSELISLLLKYVSYELETCRQQKQTPRVLVIDDENSLCQVIGEFLTAKGCRVQTISDSSQVLEHLNSSFYNFIICDIMMPAVDGISLLQNIPQFTRSTAKVLMMTGGSKWDRAQVLAYGAVDLMEKPVDLNRIYHTIMMHFIERGEDRKNFIDSVMEFKPKATLQAKLAIQQVGVGGFFVPFSAIPSLEGPLNVDDHVLLDIEVNGQKIAGPGQIVWIRHQSNMSLESGLGVRYYGVCDRTASLMEHYTRAHAIRSYVPLGAPAS